MTRIAAEIKLLCSVTSQRFAEAAVLAVDRKRQVFTDWRPG